MKLSIDSPCHEIWDNMLPNKNGAHCFSCQKTVIDFSSKSTQQIKSFFNNQTHTKGICGKFKTEQLLELSYDDFFKRFKSWHLTHKIALVLFFIFGLSLFSCSNLSKNNVLGELSINTDTTNINPINNTIIQNINAPKTSMNIDKLLAIPEKTVPIKKIISTTDNYDIMGDIAFTTDTIKKINCTIKDSMNATQMIMGKMIKKD